ncbi:hypothetical protein ABPG72_006967 [Tetrahymena utriculariae]
MGSSQSQSKLNEDVRIMYFCTEGIKETSGLIKHAYLIIQTEKGLYRSELQREQNGSKVITTLHKIYQSNGHNIIHQYQSKSNIKLLDLKRKKEQLADEFKDYNLFYKNCFHFVYNLILSFAEDTDSNKQKVLDEYDQQRLKGTLVAGSSIFVVIGIIATALQSQNNKQKQQR